MAFVVERVVKLGKPNQTNLCSGPAVTKLYSSPSNVSPPNENVAFRDKLEMQRFHWLRNVTRLEQSFVTARPGPFGGALYTYFDLRLEDREINRHRT